MVQPEERIFIEDKLRASLIGMKEKYDNEVRTFFSAMMGHFNTDEKARRRALEARQEVDALLDQIDYLLEPSNILTQADFLNFQTQLKKVDGELKAYKWEASRSLELSAAIEAIAEKHKIFLDELVYSQELFTKNIADFQQNEKEYDFGDPLGLKKESRSVVSGILGPFGIITDLVFKSMEEAKKYGKWQEFQKKTMDEKVFGAHLTSRKEDPRIRQKLGHEMAFGGVETEDAKRTRMGGRREETDPLSSFNSFMERVGGTPQYATGGSGGGTSVSFLNDLVTFFAPNGPAYRKGWTLDLLEAVRAIGKSPESSRIEDIGGEEGGKGGSGGGFLSSLLGNFLGNKAAKGSIGKKVASTVGNLTKAVLPFVGGTLGVLGSAAGGWFGGRALGENVTWGGKNLDKHVEEGFGKLFGWDKSEEKAEKSASSHPVVQRALELQKQGLSMREATVKAQMEVQLPSPNSSESQQVPIVTDKPVAKDDGGLKEILGNLSDSFKKFGKGGLPAMSGVDVFNIRNPLLQMLGTGWVDNEN